MVLLAPEGQMTGVEFDKLSVPKSAKGSNALSETELVDLIKLLGNTDIEQRNKATEKLLHHPEAAAALKNAINSEEIEVRIRAKHVLRRLEPQSVEKGTHPVFSREEISLLVNQMDGDKFAVREFATKVLSNALEASWDLEKALSPSSSLELRSRANYAIRNLQHVKAGLIARKLSHENRAIGEQTLKQLAREPHLLPLIARTPPIVLPPAQKSKAFITFARYQLGLPPPGIEPPQSEIAQMTDRIANSLPPDNLDYFGNYIGFEKFRNEFLEKFGQKLDKGQFEYAAELLTRLYRLDEGVRRLKEIDTDLKAYEAKDMIGPLILSWRERDPLEARAEMSQDFEKLIEKGQQLKKAGVDIEVRRKLLGAYANEMTGGLPGDRGVRLARVEREIAKVLEDKGQGT